MAKEDSILDECLRELLILECLVTEPSEGNRMYVVTFPDGHGVTMPETRFRLVCYRIYREVIG